MPNPKEIACVAVNGQRYFNWTTLSVNRTFGQPISIATFSAASKAETMPTWPALRLKVSDKAQILLAGRKVIDGVISARQTPYNDKQHDLQLTVTSTASEIVKVTVDHRKGEFKGYTLSQILISVFKPHGIKFRIEGNPPGADKPFPKVNVQAGETLFDFAERLCRFRNIFLIDDKDGNVVGYRAVGQPKAVADLELGRNIKGGSIVLLDENALSKIDVIGQRPGNDQAFGDAARTVKGTANNPAVTRNRPFNLIAEMPGDQRDMQMRADHELAANYATMLSGGYTVQGWFKDAETLWLEHVGKLVTVFDPFSFPGNRMTLAIQGVTSTQGPNGTLSVLDMCLPRRLGGGNQVEADGAGSAPGLYGGGEQGA